MSNALKRLACRLLPVGEVVLAPATAIAAWYLKGLRSFGLRRLPVTRRVLEQVGLLPIRHHYYEPLVCRRDLRYHLQAERSISGLDLDVNEQLALLRQFHYADELAAIPMDRGPDGHFYYNNGAFEAGDAEFLGRLKRGVLVHVHDIFTPRDYPEEFMLRSIIYGTSSISWKRSSC